MTTRPRPRSATPSAARWSAPTDERICSPREDPSCRSGPTTSPATTSGKIKSGTPRSPPMPRRGTAAYYYATIAAYLKRFKHNHERACLKVPEGRVICRGATFMGDEGDHLQIGRAHV